MARHEKDSKDRKEGSCGEVILIDDRPPSTYTTPKNESKKKKETLRTVFVIQHRKDREEQALI